MYLCIGVHVHCSFSCFLEDSDKAIAKMPNTLPEHLTKVGLGPFRLEQAHTALLEPLGLLQPKDYFLFTINFSKNLPPVYFYIIFLYPFSKRRFLFLWVLFCFPNFHTPCLFMKISETHNPANHFLLYQSRANIIHELFLFQEAETEKT